MFAASRFRHRFCAARAWLGLALFVALSPLHAAPPAKPVALSGVVTHVVDGDTLRFTPQGQPALLVRVRDIDAPEICQPWGPEARDALAALALNKAATLQPSGRDAQGRTLGVLMVGDINAARQLVEEGHAWSQRGRNDKGPLVKQERMAKALGRGMHAGGSAITPWDYRRQRGPCPEGATR